MDHTLDHPIGRDTGCCDAGFKNKGRCCTLKSMNGATAFDCNKA